MPSTSRRTDLLIAAVGLPLSGCVRDRCSRSMSMLGCVQPDSASIEQDPAIVFPPFSARAPVRIGAEAGPFAIDGRVLRALQIAADDFLPLGRKNPPCWATQEAHTYRVIRQNEVVFVRIDENPAACGRELPALHSGARYAVSLEGRLLRRLLDGQPDTTRPEASASTAPAVSAEPGVLPDRE